MEAIRQIMEVPQGHEIKIKIPDTIPNDETVEVILIFKEKSHNLKNKIKELKHAMKDDIFLNDMKEIAEDFKSVDSRDYQ